MNDLRAGVKSSRAMAKEYGVSYSLVNQQRRQLKRGEPFDTSVADAAGHSNEIPVGQESASEWHSSNGEGSEYVRFSDRPWTYEDFCNFIREGGQDPDKVTFSHGWTSRPGGGFWNKLNNVRPKTAQDEFKASEALEVLEQAVRAHKVPPRVATDPKTGQRTLTLLATDLQIGKVDWHGGTPETLSDVLTSFNRAADMAREFNVAEIAVVDAGDIIENEYNTSSQIATNDLSLPWQVGAAMRVMLEGIMILSQAAPRLKYVAVSSNHGAHRRGMKAPASDVHADYGLVIASMIETALKLSPEKFGHVEVITPEPYMESLHFETSGTDFGVVHSHQANSPDRIGEWWRGQTHGNMPVAKARILLCGHWHSLRVQQSGDSRWIIVGPSSDRGSSWFTNLKGESSTPGMLAFVTSDNEWSDLRII